MNRNILPNLRKALAHTAGTIEVNLNADDGGVTVKPLDGCLHDGQPALQERAERWTQSFAAALKPARLVQLTASVPATGCPDASLARRAVHRCAEDMEQYLFAFKNLFCPGSGDNGMAATLVAEITEATDSSVDMKVAVELTCDTSSWKSISAEQRDWVRSEVANDVLHPFLEFCNVAPSWLRASGIRQLTFEVRPKRACGVRGRTLKQIERRLVRLAD